MEIRDIDPGFVGYDNLSAEFDRVFGKSSVIQVYAVARQTQPPAGVMAGFGG